MVHSPQGPFTCPLPQLWFDTAQSLVVYIVPVSNKLLFYTHLPHPRAWGTDRMSLHLQAVGRRGEHGFRQPLGPVVGNSPARCGDQGGCYSLSILKPFLTQV